MTDVGIPRPASLLPLTDRDALRSYRAGDAENSDALFGRRMRDPGPPMSERRFLAYLAIVAAVGVLVIVLVAVLFHHGLVPK
jgi:hypothetical protein